jgi:hypothetical protein
MRSTLRADQALVGNEAAHGTGQSPDQVKAIIEMSSGVPQAFCSACSRDGANQLFKYVAEFCIVPELIETRARR